MQPDALVHIIDDDPAVRDSLAFLLQTIRIPAAVYESGNSAAGAPGKPMEPDRLPANRSALALARAA